MLRNFATASDRLSLRFLRRGVSPPRLQRPASRIRPLSAVAPARGLDVIISDLRNSALSVFGALVHGGACVCAYEEISQSVSIDI